MMKKQIVMPAHLMNDGVHTTDNGRNLFKDFSSVAQTTKTYTGQVCLPCVLKQPSCSLCCLPSSVPAHLMGMTCLHPRNCTAQQ